MAKTLVIGLGNPILGDDGVGWRVAEEVARWLEGMPGTTANQNEKPPGQKEITIDCLAVGGLSLMEHMIGYDRAILIDAILTRHNPLGAVRCFPLEDLPNRAIGHFSSAHDTTLQNALQVGYRMGVHLPDQITIVAIEAENVYDFCENLSPAISTAVPRAVEQVIQLLKKEG